MFITPSFLLIALAVYCAVILIPALLYPKKFISETKTLLTNIEFTRFTGLYGLLISFLFLSVHWKFNDGWYMLISIIGWLAFIKSVVRLWWPKYVAKMAKKWTISSEKSVTLWSFVGLLFAIGLVYIALYVY